MMVVVMMMMMMMMMIIMTTMMTHLSIGPALEKQRLIQACVHVSKHTQRIGALVRVGSQEIVQAFYLE